MEVRVPLLAQVFPCWISSNDKRYLLGSRPTLQLLFSCDCVFYFTEALEPDQAVAVILSCESRKHFLFVLQYTCLKVAGYADVKRTASARNHVREVCFVLHGDCR